MSRATWSLLASLALITTVLTAGTGNAAPAAEPAHRAGPAYHMPKVGSCHNLTLRQAMAMSAPTTAVDCDERHTTKTLVVKQLSGKVDWNAPDLWRGVFGPCARKANRVLGGDKARAMSAFGLFSFIPSKRERARGAKWKRCELGLWGGRTLQPLPKNLDLGSPPLDDKVAKCLNGPDRSLRVTVCAKAHTYRVTGGFRLSGTRYPGEQRLAKKAIDRCPKLVTTRKWRYEVPFNADQWRAGWRTIVCYSKTKK
ncbi:MAG TPA: septum formation family protein [Nocardioides sp.]|nr:septum formation family protein [Nocardioides sp.]